MYCTKIYLVLCFWVIVLLPNSASAQNKTEAKTCIDCHGELIKKKYSHKPVTEGCNKCHLSNGKAHPVKGVIGFNLTLKVPELCFTCHENKYQDSCVHRPVGDGDCRACHSVHGSDEVHLTSVLPPKQCYSCHTILNDSVKKSSILHGAMNDSLSCLICHTAHSSPKGKILKSGEKTLCLSCHNKPIISENVTISNMKKLIEKSKYIHGAIKNNGCSECHNPHASNIPNLLKASYPDDNYAPGKIDYYKLCFSSCHEKTLIEDSLTRKTGFRNKLRNLHFLHVNKDEGRSCSNCHNAHASNNLYLLIDKVNFGEWEMPLRYKKADRGGSCAPGCHEEKSYVK